MLDIQAPGSVKGEILDDYLSRGWFRCGSMMHTVDCVTLDVRKTYPVYWLRYKVDAIQLCKKNLRLIADNNRFTFSCSPYQLTNEIQNVFARYRTRRKFSIQPKLEGILRNADNYFFDSYIMEVRDKGRLIAAGIFDIGHHSIQDIINFYDPDYKKYSLGKYLMLLKYRYCLENGYTYYYPGYYIPGHETFSYKLFLDKNATEVYLPEANAWIEYYKFEN